MSWNLSSCLAFLHLIKSKPVGLNLLTGLLCFCMKPLFQPVVLHLTCSLQTAVCLLVNFKQTKNKTQSVVQFHLDVWWSLFTSHCVSQICQLKWWEVGSPFKQQKVVVSPTPFALPTLFLWGGASPGVLEANSPANHPI